MSPGQKSFQSPVNFQLLQNSAKFRENIKIPRLGSKFPDPRKTVGPISLVYINNNFLLMLR